MKITIKDLESKIDRLNTITNNPLKSYLQNEQGQYESQVGNYCLAGAYGGYELHQIVNTGGGITTPLNTGYTSKKALWYAIDNYMSGIKTERESEVHNV
tara:strand:- start:24623 stop:24919 length:297 start_codon:yes stop_codon:yes gene_type:complete